MRIYFCLHIVIYLLGSDSFNWIGLIDNVCPLLYKPALHSQHKDYDRFKGLWFMISLHCTVYLRYLINSIRSMKENVRAFLLVIMILMFSF